MTNKKKKSHLQNSSPVFENSFQYFNVDNFSTIYMMLTSFLLKGYPVLVYAISINLYLNWLN